MATRSLSVSVLLLLVSTCNYFGSCLGENSVVVSKTPQQLLSCMANCIDPGLSKELGKCGCSDPSPPKGKNTCTFLVSMTLYDTISIGNCIFRGGDRKAQCRLDVCTKKLPAQVGAAYAKCAKKIIGNLSGSAFYDALAAEPILALGIYECVNDCVTDFTPKETKQQMAYENCLRKVSPECVKKLFPSGI